MYDCVAHVVAILEKRRRAMVLRHARGRLLDIGCGKNHLVREHGNGVGVDVFNWGDVDVVVENSAQLPFAANSFDTVSFVACLNHIPYRAAALRESHRVLTNDGQLLITMIPPRLSQIWHALIRPWDEDQTERGMKEGEVWGLTAADIASLLNYAGFAMVERRHFIMGLNNLYIARKKTAITRDAFQAA